MASFRMKLEKAIGCIRRLPRFRYRNLKVRHRIGRFIPQIFIPMARRRLVDTAVRINRRGKHTMKVLWIEVSAIRSEQMCLRLDRTLWQLRNYAGLKRKKRPAIIMARGVPVLWDGNHRVTAAVLLGKKRIRCDCFFRKIAA
jgi:hypothetical protein